MHNQADASAICCTRGGECPVVHQLAVDLLKDGSHVH
jgi:hypothetical protein